MSTFLTDAAKYGKGTKSPASDAAALVGAFAMVAERSHDSGVTALPAAVLPTGRSGAHHVINALRALL